MLLLVILRLVAKRACDRSPGQWFRRGREYGGGINQLKPIFSRHLGPRAAFRAKPLQHQNTLWEFWVFKRGPGSHFNRGTRSAINMGTASLRIYVIISSSNYAGESVGNAQPPKKWWWGNWIIRDKTQQRLDYFTDKMWVCATKGCENFVCNYVVGIKISHSRVW